MRLYPVTLREAHAFVEQFHRHNEPSRGGRFALGATLDDGLLVGVAVVGRPVAKALQDGTTAEITRLCTSPEAPKNACSFLYGRAWRVWRQMGGLRLITYTLRSESGASLRGAGFRVVAEGIGGRSWDTPSRPREWQPVYGQLKFRWEQVA